MGPLKKAYKQAMADEAMRRGIQAHDTELIDANIHVLQEAGLNAVAARVLRGAAKVARSAQYADRMENPSKADVAADARARAIADRLEDRAGTYAPVSETSDHPLTPEHAYVAGQILGIALKHGLALVPVTEGGNYTGRFEVVNQELGIEPGAVRVFVNVEPPVSKTSTTELAKEKS